MTTSLHVQTGLKEGVLVARITTNSLSQYESGVVENEIAEAAPASGWRVVLDFSEVRFLASAGIGMVISVLRKCKDNKGALVVCGMGDDILNVMKMTKVNKLFTIVDDADAAIKKLK